MLKKRLFRNLAVATGIRKNGLMYLDMNITLKSWRDDYTTILEGIDFKRIISFKEEIINTNKIKGNTAFGGKTKGHVKIIKTIKDFNDFKKGYVIVSPMTTTDFTQYMSKASAIITNEGGITCHAAIISRELSIPCIIGTKIATKVLRDGDFVKVDADKGVVEILSRN